MRIISQSGWDFPYESIIIFPDENCVMAKMTNNPNFMYYLGNYKCAQRAIDVTNVIREFYLRKEPDQTAVFNMPEE